MPRGHDTMTMDFFEVPQEHDQLPGALNISLQIRSLISNELKRSPLTRYQIAARMSELLGVDVTKHQLDAWTAESRDGWRFPIEYLPALEAALETHAITRLIADVRGCRLLVGKEALNAELGKLERLRDEAAKQIKHLKRLMGEPE